MSKILLRISFGLILFATSSIFSSCNSLPGDGGTSTITGKIFVDHYNASGIVFEQYYAPDQKVYIIYGDNIAYDDEVQTSYDGTFKFQFLRQGDYTVYVYSDCLNCPGATEAKIAQVNISDNNQVVNLDDITIEKR